MGFSASASLLPPAQTLKQPPSSSSSSSSSLSPSPLDLNFLVGKRHPRAKKNRSIVPVARLFGPAIFEASKLKVVFVGGVDGERSPGRLPRTYTLTHSDITSKLTLAISNTINQAQLQGWYNRLQRDEVVAEWKKAKGEMSLHVHCHISGGHFLLDLVASLRYYIFCKELPVVLKAFMIGDESLFGYYPELEDAPVYVYFHSNLHQFNRVESWGPLRDAAAAGGPTRKIVGNSPDDVSDWAWPQRCQAECDCCFPPRGLVPWPRDLRADEGRQPVGLPEQN